MSASAKLHELSMRRPLPNVSVNPGPDACPSIATRTSFGFRFKRQ